MKITKAALKQLIREELENSLNENPKSRFTTGAKLGSPEWAAQVDAAFKDMLKVINRARAPADVKKAKALKKLMQKSIAAAFSGAPLFNPEKPVPAKTFTPPTPETDPFRKPGAHM